MLANATFDHDAALQACACGDRLALQRIYERESRFLLGVALRIVRERQQAEDVLHDAFVSIWTRAASFDPARGEGCGWIYSVVRHAALNRVRSGAREVALDEEAAAAVDDEEALQAHRASDAFELHADLGRLQECLLRLESARRECILYAYLEGCSHGEIAARLKTPLGTVKAWVQRGMGALRVHGMSRPVSRSASAPFHPRPREAATMTTTVASPEPQDAHDAMRALAAEYVLGTLSAEGRRTVERRMQREPALRAAVEGWEARLLPLTALVPPAEPSPGVWPRIAQSVDRVGAPAAPAAPRGPRLLRAGGSRFRSGGA